MSKCRGLCTAEQDGPCHQSPGYLPASKCVFATVYHTDRSQQFEDEYAGLQAAFSKEGSHQHFDMLGFSRIQGTLCLSKH